MLTLQLFFCLIRLANASTEIIEKTELPIQGTHSSCSNISVAGDPESSHSYASWFAYRACVKTVSADFESGTGVGSRKEIPGSRKTQYALEDQYSAHTQKSTGDVDAQEIIAKCENLRKKNISDSLPLICTECR